MNPGGSSRLWFLNWFNCAIIYSCCCSASFGKLGDIELPSSPWQFEHTCAAMVLAGVLGFARERERSMEEQPAPTVTSTSARVKEVRFMLTLQKIRPSNWDRLTARAARGFAYEAAL